MNIIKDGKNLYFSDEEIDNNTKGQKKVYVTKRINGKESHVKAQENNIKIIKKDTQKETFDFDNEIVIGVNVKDKEKQKETKTKNKKSKPKRYSNQKEEKSKSKKTIKIILSIIILIIAIIIFALIAPIFNITEIQVQGNEKISAETIITLSNIKKGENIFKINSTSIQSIKENTYIESVQISKNLPGTVIITVEEREVKYQINLINSYTYIDKNGYILENSTVKQQVPVIVGLSITEDEMLSKQRLKTNDLEKLNQITKIIEASKAINIDKLISEINAENENDYILYLEQKNKKIHIGDGTNLTNKMLYIQKIIENEEGKSGTAFVNGDINAGFKPYFREE